MRKNLVFKSVVTTARIAALIGAVHLVSGCAVYMAAAGDEHTTTVTNEDGTTSTQTVGKQPSPARAVVHGALDVATLGLWELVATPGELVYQETQKDTPVTK